MALRGEAQQSNSIGPLQGTNVSQSIRGSMSWSQPPFSPPGRDVTGIVLGSREALQRSFQPARFRAMVKCGISEWVKLLRRIGIVSCPFSSGDALIVASNVRVYFAKTPAPRTEVNRIRRALDNSSIIMQLQQVH